MLGLRVTLVGIACVTLMACASRPPAGFEPLAPETPTPGMAQQAPEEYRGQSVRWGGEILAVFNNARDTEFEIFGRPLYYNAEPKPDGGDGVRFIALIERFLDPADYRPGKRLTVVGRLLGNREQNVGEYPYPYPVVEVDRYHLWPVYIPPAEPPGWRYPYYDPWWPWDPWWPHRRWPYYW